MIHAFLALALLSAQPAAADGDLAHDVRCLTVLSAVAASAEDAETKNGATLLTTYFIGRIDGRMPEADLAPMVKKEVKALESADLEALIVACSNEVQARMGEIEKMAEAFPGE